MVNASDKGIHKEEKSIILEARSLELGLGRVANTRSKRLWKRGEVRAREQSNKQRQGAAFECRAGAEAMGESWN